MVEAMAQVWRAREVVARKAVEMALGERVQAEAVVSEEGALDQEQPAAWSEEGTDLAAMESGAGAAMALGVVAWVMVVGARWGEVDLEGAVTAVAAVAEELVMGAVEMEEAVVKEVRMEMVRVGA